MAFQSKGSQSSYGFGIPGYARLTDYQYASDLDPASMFRCDTEFMMTEKESFPWIQIDLAVKFYVSSIKVYPRAYPATMAYPLNVYVGDTPLLGKNTRSAQLAPFSNTGCH